MSNRISLTPNPEKDQRNYRLAKRFMLASSIALVLAVLDLYVINISPYIIAFYVSWKVIK